MKKSCAVRTELLMHQGLELDPRQGTAGEEPGQEGWDGQLTEPRFVSLSGPQARELEKQG